MDKETHQIDWKTLPEYMAMDRDEQRNLISNTTRALMYKFAKSDFPRAECVSWLFNPDTAEGRQQFYDTKGLLRAAYEKRVNWNAQQIVAFKIEKLCPQQPEPVSTLPE